MWRGSVTSLRVSQSSKTFAAATGRTFFQNNGKSQNFSVEKQHELIYLLEIGCSTETASRNWGGAAGVRSVLLRAGTGVWAGDSLCSWNKQLLLTYGCARGRTRGEREA